jgi:hypothetical protein
VSLGLKEESEFAHCNEQFHFGRLLFPPLFPLLLPYLRQLSGGGERRGAGDVGEGLLVYTGERERREYAHAS